MGCDVDAACYESTSFTIRAHTYTNTHPCVLHVRYDCYMLGLLSMRACSRATAPSDTCRSMPFSLRLFFSYDVPPLIVLRYGVSCRDTTGATRSMLSPFFRHRITATGAATRRRSWRSMSTSSTPCAFPRIP